MALVVLATNKMFIDFAGKPLHYINRLTGELIPCQVFVATLPFSDYSFAIAVPSQRIADFLYALRCCINELGGTPAVLVPDNFKSAIVKADPYEPDINRALEDFANHYNMTIILWFTRARRDDGHIIVISEVLQGAVNIRFVWVCLNNR